MHVKTLQIAWHERQPVFSCDFHPAGQLVTCGADHEIKVWNLSEGPDGGAVVTYQGSLTNHTKAVNCVRFSPKGTSLVSAGDGGEMMMWSAQPQTEGNPDGVQHWKAATLLRGHADDVLDISWSYDGSGLVSSSIENTVIVWDAEKCKQKQIYRKHKHYVQGVTWDPLGAMIISQSLDRTIKVLGSNSLKRKRWLGQPDIARTADFGVLATVYKHLLTAQKQSASPAAAGGAASASQTPNGAGTATELEERQPDATRVAGEAVVQAAEGASGPAAHAEYIFQDEGLNTFFRRLSFSPDGAFFVAPAATMGSMAASSKCASAAVIFSRRNLTAPSAILPSLAAGSTCVRFCPVFFKSQHPKNDRPRAPAQEDRDANALAAAPVASQGALDDDKRETADGAADSGRLLQLPYKLVFAVGCIDSVIIYDTDSDEPLAVLGAIHYKHVTDLAWSPDGLCLAVTSHDGYCTLAKFRPGELGEPLPLSEAPNLADIRAEIAELEAHKSKKRASVKPSAATPGAPSATQPQSPVQPIPGQPSASPGTQPAASLQAKQITPDDSGTDDDDGELDTRPRLLKPTTTSAAVSNEACTTTTNAAPCKRRVSPQLVSVNPSADAKDTSATGPGDHSNAEKAALRGGANEVNAAQASDSATVQASGIGATDAAPAPVRRRLAPQAVVEVSEIAGSDRMGSAGKGAPSSTRRIAPQAISEDGVINAVNLSRPESAADADAGQGQEMAEPAFARGQVGELVALPEDEVVAPKMSSLALLAAKAGAAAADVSDDD